MKKGLLFAILLMLGGSVAANAAYINNNTGYKIKVNVFQQCQGDDYWDYVPAGAREYRIGTAGCLFTGISVRNPIDGSWKESKHGSVTSKTYNVFLEDNQIAIQQ